MRFVPLGLLVFALVAQSNQSGEWRHYSRDLASSRYSPLDLLTRENIGELSYHVTASGPGKSDEILERI